MRLKSAIQGDLQKIIKQEFHDAEKAVTSGIKEATIGLKMSMRRQVLSAGLGQRMANTWRGNIYPKSQNSIRAAGLVYTKASKVLSGFEESTIIRSKNGLWLAIPTPNAPKKGVGGKRISPSNFPEHRFGKLRFIYQKNGPSLLVAEKLQASFKRKTGALRGFKKASKRNLKTGQRLTTVVMFWLVPQVKMPRLIHFKKESKKWQSQLPALILKNWTR